MERTIHKTTSEKTQLIARMAILTAIGAVLYRIEIPLLVAHQKIDPSLIPSLIGGLMLGPIYGVIIEFLKNITHLFVSTTVGVGELINFIVGSSLILPVCFIYKKFQTKKSYILGSVLGMVSVLLVGAICNYIFTPLFYAVMGLGSPSTAEIMGFVVASFALNSLKGVVTLVPTFLILPAMKRNKY